MESTASVKKIALNYGVLWGMLSIVLSVILYVTNNYIGGSWVQSLAGTIIMIGAIVYGLKAFKSDNEGFLSLSEALKVGLAISVIAAIITTLYFYLFITVIETTFIEQSLEFQRENMITSNPNMSEEQLEARHEINAKIMTPGIMSSIALMGTLFFGFITALIAGLVMKNNRPD